MNHNETTTAIGYTLRTRSGDGGLREVYWAGTMRPEVSHTLQQNALWCWC